jgi:hypothetical protein
VIRGHLSPMKCDSRSAGAKVPGITLSDACSLEWVRYEGGYEKLSHLHDLLEVQCDWSR